MKRGQREREKRQVPTESLKDGIELPPDIEWPKDARAKNIARALYRDMSKSRHAALSERQKAYKAACLSWHPDKNRKHEDLATEVFQFLQTLKKWYFA